MNIIKGTVRRLKTEEEKMLSLIQEPCCKRHVLLFFFAETRVEHWSDGQNRPGGGDEREALSIFLKVLMTTFNLNVTKNF